MLRPACSLGIVPRPWMIVSTVSSAWFLSVTFLNRSSALYNFHGSLKPGKRSFGCFSRPLLEVYFTVVFLLEPKVKSLAVAEISCYCKGFCLSHSYFCVLDQKYKRGLLRATFSQEVHLSNSATWERRKFREIASLRRAKYTPSHADSRACVELEHIEQQTGRLINYVDSAEQNSIKSVFKQGDVLFGKLRPYLRKYCLPQFDGVCSSEIWVLVPETCVVSEYLFYLVQSDEFLAAANISSGTKMPRAEWSKVSNEDYFIPLISEQKRIARMLSIVDHRITTASEMLSALERMRKSFLQQLFI